MHGFLHIGSTVIFTFASTTIFNEILQFTKASERALGTERKYHHGYYSSVTFNRSVLPLPPRSLLCTQG